MAIQRLTLSSFATKRWRVFTGLALVLGGCNGTAVCAQEHDTALNFSAEFGVYAKDASAKTVILDTMYARTLTQVRLKAPQEAARRAVITLYREFGVDVTFDNEHNPSQAMVDKMPRTWSKQTPQPLSGEYKQPYSVDAPWNHAIPRSYPRTALPEGYFKTVEITSPASRNAPGGDGFGIGIVISGASDPIYTVASAATNQSIESVVRLHIRPDCDQSLPTNVLGAQRLILVDSADNTVVDTYETRIPGDPRGFTLRGKEQFKQEGRRAGFDYRALAMSAKQRLDGIGAESATDADAAGIPLLGLALRKGEATDPGHPITHALGGAASQLMKARVYPARGWTSTIDTSVTNAGCVPFGGLVQLDPELDLAALYKRGKFSLPAFRILQAIQTYGWYLCDSSDGGAGKGIDFQIFGSAPAAEFAPFHPPSGTTGGIYGVARELQDFFQGKPFFDSDAPRFYVVAPLVKRQ